MTETTVNNLPDGGNALIVPVPIWQGTINGLYALLNWLDGFESAGKGNIPGHLELTTHFRSLKYAIYELENTKAPSPNKESHLE